MLFHRSLETEYWVMALKEYIEFAHPAYGPNAFWRLIEYVDLERGWEASMFFTYMYFRWMKKRYSLEFQYWVKPTVRRMGGNRGGQMPKHLPFL